VTSFPRPVAGPSVWPRRLRLLRRGAAATSLLTLLVGLLVALATGAATGAYLALLVSTTGVLLASHRPTLGLFVTVSGVYVAVVAGWDPTATCAAAVLTLFSAMLAGVPPFWSGPPVAASLYLAVAWLDQHSFHSADGIAVLSNTVAVGGIGGGLRAHARYWGVLEQRAADSAAQAVTRERLRIARDLHDLVGHALAALNMHLGVAEVSLPPGAQKARSALGEARASVQLVLSETQQILALLRSSDTGLALDDPNQPTPGTEQLGALVASAGRLGLQLDADLHALDGWPASPAAGVTLYRVVQEALTNASRYSDGAARLTLERRDDVLTLTVSNRCGTQRHTMSGRSGYGLVGIRERLAAIGGDLRLDAEHGTFQLTATLPARSRSTR
jgi:signal transduction histidine kinase